MIKEKQHKNKNKIKKLLNVTLCFSMITLILFSNISVHARSSIPENPSWKNYPYCPPGTDICFPYNEGSHCKQTYPIEWWYINLHLTGKDTGNEYGSFVAFFQIITEYPWSAQYRVFSIADVESETTFTNAENGNLISAEGYLDLLFASANGIDIFYTKRDDNDDLIAFEYMLSIAGTSQEDKSHMELNVDMISEKKPMIVGGDGYIFLGSSGHFSYYYSLTKLATSGLITVNGITEEVTGYAWIDHQWGDFINNNPPPFGLPITYEWFSIKLDDNREIMAGDTWDRATGKMCTSFSNGINILDSNGNLEILEDYTITQLDFWTDPLSGRRFAIQWQITEPTKSIDLIITPKYANQMMHATKDGVTMQWLADLIPGSCFWEGVCTVSGSIDGVPVFGDAFVELTHSFDIWDQLVGDKGYLGTGFGTKSNIATRGMEIFNGELYIGTENLKKLNIGGTGVSSQSNEVSVSQHQRQELDTGSMELSVEEQNFILSDDTSQYILEAGEYTPQGGVKPMSGGDDVFGYYLEYETFQPGGLVDLTEELLTKGMRAALHLRTTASQGCEIWKYNHQTNTLINVIGSGGSANGYLQPGFGYSRNAAASVMREFNGYLYVGTWSSPIGDLIGPNQGRSGCEVYRFDGSVWEQVVGPSALTPGGFGDSDNVAAWSIETFNDYLYIGTMNWDFTENGGCQIFRSNDGVNWEQVVDRGFRGIDGMQTEAINTYAWYMTVFQGRLYVGTFNSKISISGEHMGAQLWSSANGVDWVKEELPSGDGFGHSEMYGIRRMVNYNDEYLYVGTASNVGQSWPGDVVAAQVWRYDGIQWECLMGNQLGYPTNHTQSDGFGDIYNKYVWSMDVTGNGTLYAGTVNVQIKYGLPDTKGCQIFSYTDADGWTPIVKGEVGNIEGEMPSGFGKKFNTGARSIKTYPADSETIIVGTFSLNRILQPVKGLELWIRNPDKWLNGGINAVPVPLEVQDDMSGGLKELPQNILVR